MVTKKSAKKAAVKKKPEAAKPKAQQPDPARGAEGDGDNTIKRTSADGSRVWI